MSVRQLMKQYLPMPMLLKAKLFMSYAPLDLLDWMRGRTDPLVPGRRKVFIGGPEYRKVGDEFMELFRLVGKLEPHHKALDIGCGIGRMARPLVAFLDSARGRYDGFDIDRNGILWCMEHYLEHPHFRFQWANIYNKFYNPRGSVAAEDFTFPYENRSFDFAFATSVFTHMPPGAIRRYLAETSRVLVPGGRALFTVFLWNDQSRSLVSQGKSAFPFHDQGDLIVKDPLIPEEAIAVRQNDWEAALAAAGLESDGAVHWGSWCGRPQFTSFQDVVVVRKRN